MLTWVTPPVTFAAVILFTLLVSFDVPWFVTISELDKSLLFSSSKLSSSFAPTVAPASMPPNFETLFAGNALPEPSMSAAAIFALERICVVPIFCKDPSVAKVMLEFFTALSFRVLPPESFKLVPATAPTVAPSSYESPKVDLVTSAVILVTPLPGLIVSLPVLLLWFAKLTEIWSLPMTAPLPVPIPAIAPLLILISLFRIDWLAFAGFLPALKLVSFVISASVKGFNWVKLPALFNLNPIAPSVLDKVSNSALFAPSK